MKQGSKLNSDDKSTCTEKEAGKSEVKVSSKKRGGGGCYEPPKDENLRAGK